MDTVQFNDLLKIHQPDLYEKVTAEQASLSEEILDIRLDAGLDVSEMARFLNLSEEVYLKYEFGDLDFSVKEYNALISKMKVAEFASILFDFSDNIPNLFSEYLFSEPVLKPSFKNLLKSPVIVELNFEIGKADLNFELLTFEKRHSSKRRVIPPTTKFREVATSFFTEKGKKTITEMTKYKEEVILL